jgi:hypothetical protein
MSEVCGFLIDVWGLSSHLWGSQEALVIEEVFALSFKLAQNGAGCRVPTALTLMISNQ